jgi:hypothetical protein
VRAAERRQTETSCLQIAHFQSCAGVRTDFLSTKFAFCTKNREAQAASCKRSGRSEGYRQVCTTGGRKIGDTPGGPEELGLDGLEPQAPIKRKRRPQTSSENHARGPVIRMGRDLPSALGEPPQRARRWANRARPASVGRAQQLTFSNEVIYGMLLTCSCFLPPF